MEMNTRLQVEHTITEEITGIDIVRKQFEIAAGEKLNLAQDEISISGIAAQFRINCEDPKNHFLPSFGKVTQYDPLVEPGIRIDAAIYTGYDIPIYYDSLCAKLVVWSMSWPELLDKSKKALEKMGLHGVKTTIPFYLEIIKNKTFQSGDITTDFLEQYPELLNYHDATNKHLIATVLAAACVNYYGAG
jgi:pyruvate carboxylase subunit A